MNGRMTGNQTPKEYPIKMKRLSSIIILTACLFIGFTAGCASLVGDDPQEMLRQTVSSLISEDDFSFDGTAGLRISEARLARDYAFTGYVSGHNKIYIEADNNQQLIANDAQLASGKLYYAKVNKRWTTESGSEKQLNPLYTWNPIIQLEHLNRVAGKGRVEGESQVTGQTVLRAVIHEDELLQQVKEQIRHEHHAVITAAREAADSIGHEQLQGELEAYIQEAEKELNEWLGSLKLTSHYELFLQTRSRRLHAMNVEARLEYEADGKSKSETLIKTYRFRD